MHKRLILVLLPVVLMSASCARYEYDVIQPQTTAIHAGEKEDVVVEQEPITYRIRSVDDRLVIRAFNGTGEKIELVGVKSHVVDQTGKSRALTSQRIMPGGFAKLILPPNKPETIGSDGTRGGAMGATGYGPGLSRGEYGFGDDVPPTTVLRASNETYWEWTGESTVRVVLVYRVKEAEITQELRVGRRRVEK